MLTNGPHPNPLPAGEGTVNTDLPAGEGTVNTDLPAGEGNVNKDLLVREGTVTIAIRPGGFAYSIRHRPSAET